MDKAKGYRNGMCEPSGRDSMEKDIVIREYKPGDPSRVCYFYYKLFEQQYRFNGIVEKYFMEGMLDLFEDHEGSQMWVVERNGQIVGSIAIIKRGDEDAQLRWFGIDMFLQGQGIGNKLMQIAMNFCKEKGYKHVILWSIDILKSARHLYRKFGFIPTETKPNHEWAPYSMIEEKWEYNAGCQGVSRGRFDCHQVKENGTLVKGDRIG